MATENFQQNVNITSEYIGAYDFEVFDIQKTRQILAHYRSYVYVICVLYILAVFAGQDWMRKRPAYKLKTSLFVWNIFLATFSFFGFLRSFPECLYLIKQEDGFRKVVCELETHNYATGFWALLFTLSKLFEFGDTVFIVLRKQKLIFLHWYHHISALIMAWTIFECYDPGARVMVNMNYFIHTLMYSYYALKSMGIKVPKGISKAITVMQIVQMFVVLYVGVYTYGLIRSGKQCSRPLIGIYITTAVYGSFFILFINFFVRTYLIPPQGKHPKLN